MKSSSKVNFLRIFYILASGSYPTIPLDNQPKFNYMKTLKSLLAVVAFISILSCSKDDESVSADESQIVGVWNLEQFEYSTDTTIEGISASSTGNATNIDATLEFKEDKTFIMGGSYTIVLTTEGMTNNYPVDNAASSGSWELDGNTLFVEGLSGAVGNNPVLGNSESEMKISELSANRMVLLIDQNEDYSVQGSTVTIKADGKYVLTR